MTQAAAPSQSYFRTDSSDSAARMLGVQGPSPRAEKYRRKQRCSPVWLAVAAMGILALQIASTTGLFVYFTMSISKLKAQAQGSSEEGHCLLLLNRMEELSELDELIGNQSCLKLASSIKAYVAMITENIIHKSAQTDTSNKPTNTSGGQLVIGQPGSKPSAHLTLRGWNPTRAGSPSSFGDLPQSCQLPIPYWGNKTMHSHLQNLTYRDGKLHVSQAGKYYIYAQIYFHYPTEGLNSQALGHQLVQCINLQSTNGQTIPLLKGVGTKCWTQDATYGLHALYQGGLFDLKAGDKLFVSVSTWDINYNDAEGTYFGAFRLDA